MSLILYSSSFWGVKTQTISANTNLDFPILVSAVSIDVNTVRLTFDRNMRQELSQGLPFMGGTLTISSYSIIGLVSGNPLYIIRTASVDAMRVDLITEDQSVSVIYRVMALAGGAMDEAGNVITQQTADFTGIGSSTFPTPVSFGLFSSGYPGMQEGSITDLYPDLNPPYIDPTTQNPMPGEIGVDVTPIIYLDILDDDNGVDELSVWIKVDGAFAWKLNSVQFGFSATKSTILDGYRYQIERIVPFSTLSVVLIEVYAEDLAAIHNILSTSYSFTTQGGVHGPFLRYRDPEIDVGGVASTASFSFYVLDGYNDVMPNTLAFYVNSTQAYDGASLSWFVPYDGLVERVENVDGYDGYHVRIDHPALPASSRVSLRVIAQDSQASVLDETYGFWIAPALISAMVDPYETTLKLVFSGAMEPLSLLDGSLFQLSNGAYTRKVDILDAYQVRLWVERFQGTGPFTLVVSNTVRDIHDGYLVGAGGSFEIFQSNALFSNTDGLVRSWHDSRRATRDGQRLYLAGTRGLDVFDERFGIMRPSRWGQILDAYGITAMCLVKTGDGYEFFESDAPILCDQTPAPEATVLSPDIIQFSIVDNITSIETVSLIVYVGGTLAFSGGSGGWANNWGGQITVHPHKLEVELYPPQSFTSGTRVSLRVLASNLLGGVVDRTYAFNIML